MSLPNEVSATLTLWGWREGQPQEDAWPWAVWRAGEGGHLSTRQCLALAGKAHTPPPMVSASRATYRSLHVRSSLGKGWMFNI